MEQYFHEDGWSLDACAGRILADGSFSREQILCMKTLYNYVEMGIIGVKGIDLPSKLSRKPRKIRCHENKKVLGRSIEKRPAEIDERQEFGHWETDLVIGSKTEEDNVLLTLIERKTRNLQTIRLPDNSADSVFSALEDIKKELGDKFSEVFKGTSKYSYAFIRHALFPSYAT